MAASLPPSHAAPLSPKLDAEPTPDPFPDLLLPPIEGDDDAKLQWLRSQVIGEDAGFASPFGWRRLTYCDHTASGRLLKVVEDYLQDRVYPFYGNTHTGDSFVGLHSTNLMKQAAQYVKQCLGGGPQDVILFCGTGCTGAIKRLQEVMGLIVPPILRSTVLSCLPTSDRWVVFLGPYEHHSNLLSWQQSLADVVEIGLDESGGIDLTALEIALRSPEYAGRRKIGSFSAASNITGTMSDTRAIARLLHENDAYACFDFACSGPYVKIEMKSGEVDGYDAVFLSPHKFMGGPGSPGILLMSNELYCLKDGPPSTSGGGTVQYVGYNKEDTVYNADPEEREDAGTPAIIQKVRAALAFRVKEYLGHGLIFPKEEELAKVVMARLSGNPNLFMLCGNGEDRQPVVSFLVYPKIGGASCGKSLHCRFVTVLFNDLFGIQARGGCACAGPYVHHLLGIGLAKSKAIRASIERGYEGVKPGFTRITFSYYAPPEEIEFVLRAMEFVALHGHRFLALYDFDWRSGQWLCRSSQIESLLGSRVLPSNRKEMRNGEAKGDLKEIYSEYMSIASCMAEALPDEIPNREVPDYIDPTLVLFL